MSEPQPSTSFAADVVSEPDVVEQEGIENLDIQETLLEMRHHRMGLIQTPDQLRFSYQAVIEGAKRLDPEFKDEDELEDSIYVLVGEEEAPPPPPPRAESLTRAPARPLPAIPASESLGNLNLSAPPDSSSDESPPTPVSLGDSLSASSADDEAEEPATNVVESTVGEGTELRRRRTRELADRVSNMKRKAREAERWHRLKRAKLDRNKKEHCEDEEEFS